MHLEKYPFKFDKSFMNFEFYSHGPKGSIKKVVKYSMRYSNNGKPFFNLGFGDWDPVGKKIDDRIRTDNGDRDKILATVANTLILFSEHYPDKPVYIEGSSLSRLRLYQILITKYLEEISERFIVYGLVDNIKGWEEFEKNKKYLAFMVILKKIE